MSLHKFEFFFVASLYLAHALYNISFYSKFLKFGVTNVECKVQKIANDTFSSFINSSEIKAKNNLKVAFYINIRLISVFMV